MSSPYERGRRGRGRGFGRRDQDNGDRKRPYDNNQGNRPGPSRGFQKRGRGGKSRGRGRKNDKPEFHDVIVTRPETAIQKSAFEAEDEKSKQVLAKDTTLEVLTNYFRVIPREKNSMTMYHIDFNPPTEDRFLKRDLIRESSHILGLHIYDGSNSVYLMNKLDYDEMNIHVNVRNYLFNMTFRKTREIHYTNSMFFTILNLIVRGCFEALRLHKIDRNYYDPTVPIRVPEQRVDFWPGYLTSIRQHEQDLLLCCELTFKLVRTENVWTAIKDIARIERGNYKMSAERKFVGTTVLTTYNNKKYPVDGIDWQTTFGTSSFLINGEEKSYAQYYREKYNIDHLDPNQPLLISKSKAKDIRGGALQMISLVPQLCQPTGFDDSMRQNFQMMRKLAESTRMTPTQRVEKLRAFNFRLQGNQQCRKIFEENKLMLEEDLVKVKARRIQQERVYFGEGQFVELHANSRNCADWTTSMKGKKMFVPMKLDRWIYMYPKACESHAMAFLDKMIEAGTNMGMEIVDAQGLRIEVLPQGRLDYYIEAIRKCLSKDPSFIVVVLESDHADKYAAIKKTCYINNSPVPIQVLCLKTIASSRHGIMSVANKVAIQINCKLGGTPWLISIPLTGLLVIGFDVTHDTKDKRKSYSAMVASMMPIKKQEGQFFCCANHHKDGEQISNYLGVNVLATVNQYQKLYGTLPQKIIIYRDGVGDGQIEYVNKFEVKDVVSKLNRFYGFNENEPNPEKKPQIGFIIVNKRINTRFFARCQNGYENPLPGTVVDSVVTLPERYDFYLISQNVTQGTVAPISYNIIYDTLGMPTPIIQKLTFKLCHNYFNWSGTTRVPSVVQYAKKLALLVGQHLHQEPTKFTTEKMLYFL